MEKNLNISIIAPRGTGKTTLIGALYNYAVQEIKDGDGYKFEVVKNSKSLFDTIKESLDKFMETLETSYGTNEVEKLSFRYDFGSFFCTKIVNINFVDVPGGFTENAEFGGYGDKQYESFEKHLQTSPILIIPIDTPCLMEGDKFQALASLDTHNIQKMIEQWAQFRDKADEHAILNFAMLKYEYYKYDDMEKDVFDKFCEYYQDIILSTWKTCPKNLEVNYLPIEIFGNIHLDKQRSEWQDNQYIEQFCNTGGASQSSGLNNIWIQIQRYVNSILDDD